MPGTHSRLKYSNTCKFCQQDFYPFTRNSKYCSNNCFNLSKKKGKEVECSFCRKKIYRKRKLINKSKIFFCDRRCKSKAQIGHFVGEKSPRWTGGDQEVLCLLCKDKVLRRLSLVQKRNRFFCSGKCWGIYQNKYIQKNKNTDIEILMEEILIKTGLNYQSQYVIPKIGIADFYIPEQNLLIFCDGEYWHNFPYGKFRDRRQMEQLKKLEYQVLRLWGKEIKKLGKDMVEAEKNDEK